MRLLEISLEVPAAVMAVLRLPAVSSADPAFARVAVTEGLPLEVARVLS
jgi:hypothetical protein